LMVDVEALGRGLKDGSIDVPRIKLFCMSLFM
jgi:hypothetical protein